MEGGHDLDRGAVDVELLAALEFAQAGSAGAGGEIVADGLEGDVVLLEEGVVVPEGDELDELEDGARSPAKARKASIS